MKPAIIATGAATVIAATVITTGLAFITNTDWPTDAQDVQQDMQLDQAEQEEAGALQALERQLHTAAPTKTTTQAKTPRKDH